MGIWIALLGLLWVQIQASTPTFSIPTNLETGRVIVLPNVTTSGTTVNFNVPYSAVIFTNTPKLAWGISGIQFTPASTVEYRLLLGSQTLSDFSFSLTIGAATTIQYISAHYLAFDILSFINTRPISPTLSCSIVSEYYFSTSPTSQLSNSAYLGKTRIVEHNFGVKDNIYNLANRAYGAVFVVGMTASTSATDYDIEFKSAIRDRVDINRRYNMIQITIGPQTLLQAFYIVMLTFDDYETSIIQDLHISFYDVRYDYAVVRQPPPIFDPATTAYIIGLTQFNMLNGSPYIFDFNNNPASDVLFSGSLELNGLAYIGISKMTCGPQFLNRATQECFTTRNGCPLNYQSINMPDFPKKIVFNSDNSLFVVMFNGYLSIYRYNSGMQYYQIDFEVLINGNDFQISDDFSKLAVCGGETAQVYAWNGTMYKLKYQYESEKGFSFTGSKVTLSQDGSGIVFGGEVKQLDSSTPRQITIFVSYDPLKDIYVQKGQKYLQSVKEYGFFQDENDKLFIIDSKSYSSYERMPPQYFFQIRHQFSVTVDDTEVFTADVSLDSHIIAIYSIVKSPSHAYDYMENVQNGVTILQYDQGLGYHVFFQFITHRYTATQQGGGVHLNADGTVLAIQHNSNQVSVQSIWRRSTINDQFEHQEVIKNLPTTDTNLYTTLDKTTISISPDGKVLAAMQQANSNGDIINLYFCPSDIGGPYTIPSVQNLSSIPPISPSTPTYTVTGNSQQDQQDLKNLQNRVDKLSMVAIIQTISLILLGGTCFFLIFKFLKHGHSSLSSHFDQQQNKKNSSNNGENSNNSFNTMKEQEQSGTILVQNIIQDKIRVQKIRNKRKRQN